MAIASVTEDRSGAGPANRDATASAARWSGRSSWTTPAPATRRVFPQWPFVASFIDPTPSTAEDADLMAQPTTG